MSKGDEVDQFLWEKPVHHRPRRLVNWINLTGAVPAPLGRAGIVSRRLCLRESCMRENCTYSLSGGRWPAHKRATSDPTGHDVGEVSEALRKPKGGAMDRPSRKRWPKARTRRRGQ